MDSMDSPITAVIGVMIPIVAIVMGIGIGMLSLLLDYRKKREIRVDLGLTNTTRNQFRILRTEI